jgi:hypothetical protein
VWCFKSIILASQEIEIRRIIVQGQHGQKVCKTPPQPIKARSDGMYLSSQLCRKHK